MNYRRLYVVLFLEISIQCDVDDHSQEEKILIEGQKVLHVADFWKNLIDHESQSSQIFSKLVLLDIIGEVIVFFEDKGWKGLGRNNFLNGAFYLIHEANDDDFLWLWKLKYFSEYLLVI